VIVFSLYKLQPELVKGVMTDIDLSDYFCTRRSPL